MSVVMLSIFSRLWNSSSDTLYWRLQIVSSVLVGLAFIVGFWTVRVGARANRRANSELADTKLKAAELQASLAPRRIAPLEQKLISSSLKQFSERIAATIFFTPGDTESEMFGWDIASTLHRSNWQVFAPASVMVMSATGRPFDLNEARVQTGVTIVKTRLAISSEAAHALFTELTKAGFDSTIRDRIEERDDPVVAIEIKSRPIGPQGAAKVRAGK